MVFLEFKEVKKSFGDKEVLRDISFSVQEREIFGLVGSSGGGKTTLLKILVGMARANGGGIVFEDRNVLRRPYYLRKNTGFATQKNMLFDELTLRENAFYFGKLYSMSNKDINLRFRDLVNLLGLGGFENVQIDNYSGGMVKRANLLIALIHSPKLLVLDEPTVGLDPVLRDILWKYIHNINVSDGTTILVISHLLDEIEDHCSRAAILKKGKIVAMGSIEQYKKAYRGMTFPQIFEAIIKNENI